MGGASEAHDEVLPDCAWATLDDARLLVRLRTAEAPALREFVRRFRPVLLDQSRRLRVAPSEREAVIESFFDDLILRIADAPRPRSLAAYVIRSFRNDVLLARRRDAHQAARTAQHADDTGGVSVVRETCSAYTLRAVLAADAMPPACEHALVALGAHVLRSIAEPDRLLLEWRAEGVPTGEIAAWLGISHGAARVRISRLRARLVSRALEYRETVSTADGKVLDRFFRRAGIAGAAAAPSSASPAAHAGQPRTGHDCKGL